MSRNLIVGGFVFLGSYLVQELLKLGEEVVVLDSSTPGPLACPFGDRVRAVRGTSADWELLLETMSQDPLDTVFHVGALVPPASEEDLYETYRSNIVGTVNILEGVRLSGVQRVVYASSQAVFGAELPREVDEDQVRRPWTMYGVSKACEEQIGEAYLRRYGVDFRGIIFPPLIGPGRTKYGLSGFSGWTAGGFAGLVMDFVVQGKPYVFNVGRATTIPSAVYIKDAARAMVSLRGASESRLSRCLYVIHGLSVNVGLMCDAILRVRPDARLYFEPDSRVMRTVESWPRLNDVAARTDWEWSPVCNTEEKMTEDFLKVLEQRPDLCCWA
jgi:nucleoside-diphosphate-sugar epimerase